MHLLLTDYLHIRVVSRLFLNTTVHTLGQAGQSIVSTWLYILAALVVKFRIPSMVVYFEKM